MKKDVLQSIPTENEIRLYHVIGRKNLEIKKLKRLVWQAHYDLGDGAECDCTICKDVDEEGS